MVTKSSKVTVKIRTQDLIDLLINSNYDVDSLVFEEGQYVGNTRYNKKVDLSKWTLHADGQGVTVEWSV
jgi:hypothetical protein